MAQTPEEQRLAHARAQAVYRATAKGKIKEKTWRGSPTGRQAVKKNNQVQRDKRRDALNRARAAEQQRVRDAEDKAKRIRLEAIALYGQKYVDNPSGSTGR